MPGVYTVAGSDLRLSNIQIPLDGSDPPPVTARLRTDMWPHWLRSAVGDAQLAEVEAQRLRDDPDNDAVRRSALEGELLASMRAVAACAFAIDAFYASVKARSPRLSVEQVWRANGTARHAQIAETLRRHLKIKQPFFLEMRTFFVQLFKFRGWAVHPGSAFKEPVYRPEIDAGIDWHFAAFRAENAVTSVQATVCILDRLVGCLERGSEELVKWAPAAATYMDELVSSLPKQYRTLLPDGRSANRPARPAGSGAVGGAEAGAAAEPPP